MARPWVRRWRVCPNRRPIPVQPIERSAPPAWRFVDALPAAPPPVPCLPTPSRFVHDAVHATPPAADRLRAGIAAVRRGAATWSLHVPRRSTSLGLPRTVAATHPQPPIHTFAASSSDSASDSLTSDRTFRSARSHSSNSWAARILAASFCSRSWSRVRASVFRSMWSNFDAVSARSCARAAMTRGGGKKVDVVTNAPSAARVRP